MQNAKTMKKNRRNLRTEMISRGGTGYVTRKDTDWGWLLDTDRVLFLEFSSGFMGVLINHSILYNYAFFHSLLYFTVKKVNLKDQYVKETCIIYTQGC